MAKRRFGRVRTLYRKVRHRRSSGSGFGSTFTPVIAGVGAGLAYTFIRPYIANRIPSIGPIPADAVAMGAVGLGAKMLLRKDPMHIPSAMVMGAGLIAGLSLMQGTMSNGAASGEVVS